MMKQNGVSTLFSRHVSVFEHRKGKLCGLRFRDCAPLDAEIAVVTAGPLIGLLAADLPKARSIRPVRGYSPTVHWSRGSPRVSLTDVKRKLAFAAIGDRLRVAGLADIERPGTGFDAVRFETLRTAASTVLPGVFDQQANET